MTRPIFLLTDFGLTDTYVGIVKAVILGIAPAARIVDLIHEILPQDIRAGAYALLTAAPYLPADAVVLAVVDPGVGTERRPVAVQAGRRTFIGPDNGLLSWALAGAPALPTGTTAVVSTAAATTVSGVVLDRPAFWLPQISATFHGRDIFGPVAAHVANGVPLTDLGTVTALDTLTHLPFPAVDRILDATGQLRELRGEIIHVDRYGNLITNIAGADVPPEPVIGVGGRVGVRLDAHQIRGLSESYQSGPRPSGADRSGAGPLLALIGSAGFLEVAAPNGSAASIMGATVGTAVVVQSGPALPWPP